MPQREDPCSLQKDLGEHNHTWKNCVFRKAHVEKQEASKDSSKGSKKKVAFNSESHAAEADASNMEVEPRSDSCRWGPDSASVMEPAHLAEASLEATGKQCDAASNCCTMQCSENTHSLMHNLDLQERPSVLYLSLE